MTHLYNLFRSRRHVFVLSIFITVSLFLILKQFKYIIPNAHPERQQSSASQQYAILLTRDLQQESLEQQSSTTVGKVDHSVMSNKLAAIEIAIIFRHGDKSARMQANLQTFLSSLLEHSSRAIRLYIVTDEKGYVASTAIIKKVLQEGNFEENKLQPVLISTDDLDILSTNSTETKTIKLLQHYFTSKKEAYYSDPLFFFSFFLHEILPSVSRIILMDIDIKVEGDIAELYGHFEKFRPGHVLGLSHELSVVYRHNLGAYRKSHRGTLLGSPPAQGGFPGYNSGVMLIDTKRLKESKIIASYLTEPVLANRSQHYSFTGHLGDQDLYTLMAFDHPGLFYTLPCQWNRQLCEWWRDKGYSQVFDQYFECKEPIKIFHGNCKSKIPGVSNL